MKILHVEDNPRDAELVRDMLQLEWPDCIITVVATREAFLAGLIRGGYDLVLSDFQLPGFNGLEALELTREKAPDVPFIFFSGTIGEERAIEAVRAGASDYVIKDRMQRLPVSIQRVMREGEEARARRRVEEALAQEQYLLLMLMENMPDHVYFKDARSRFITVSRAMARRHGLLPADMKGKTDFDFFSEEHARQAFEDEQTIMRTGEPMVEVEEKETWPDGSVTWVSSTKVPLRDASGGIAGTFGISRDITARKHAEERMREQAEIIDRAPVAIIISGMDNRITYCNDGAVQLYGLPREALLGSLLGEVLTTDTMRQLTASQSALETTGRWTGEIPVLTRSGRQFQAEFHLSLIHDAAGRPRARLTIAIDSTDKQKIQEQFLRAQRLESLGMLSAGIAHDLNNILAPVLMGAPLLRLRSTHPSDLRVLEAIESSAARGAGLVRQILSFAHGTSGDKALLQARHLVRDIANFIQQTFPKSIDFEFDLPNDLWTVQGNPTQLHQVLLNLCVNARDAMPKGGKLSLRLANRQMEAGAGDPAGGHTVAGPYLMIEVADSGEGIPAEIMAKIWDPFFTTKGEGKGTGLGLATVRGIVTNHGGFVQVDSKPGRGTVFRIFLPAVEQTARAGPASRTASPFLVRGQGELVLVVDDEISIRDLITAALGRYGYRVLAAANGNEAMALYPTRRDEIALVVTDLSMPEMGGDELALALSRLNPAVRILFMSGATGTQTSEVLPKGARVLTKPFTIDRLITAVHEALEVPSTQRTAK
jgi:two-component system cell cycle sensor histidine kinase/response regulator CckA